MRAAVFKGPGIPLQIETLPDPEPAPGEVVLKVGGCGICGSDLHLTDGHGTFQASPGEVLGHEYAGEVVAVGRGVQRIRVGDRVTAMPSAACGACPACARGEPKWCPERAARQGGYAEYLRAQETSCAKLAANLTLEDGALVEPLAVGLHGVERAGLQVGDKVLIIGAGPVGLATLFWAKRMGAGRVVVTAPSTRRAALALELGADDFVAGGDDAVEAVNAKLGGPPDVVFECVGMPGVIGRAIDHVRPLGAVVVMGFCTTLDHFLPVTALFKEVRMVFAVTYAMRDFKVAIDTLDKGFVTPRAMVTHRIGLDELPAAFEALRQRSDQCKVMVDPWRTPATAP